MKGRRTALHVLLLAVVPIFSLSACGRKSSPTWQEQYDLGAKYLSEGNYQEALLAFTAAIEIDPKQVDAYIGLARACPAKAKPDQPRHFRTGETMLTAVIPSLSTTRTAT